MDSGLIAEIIVSSAYSDWPLKYVLLLWSGVRELLDTVATLENTMISVKKIMAMVAAVGFCVVMSVAEAGKPVEMSVRDQEGRVAIAVKNEGPAVSEANQKRIFDRFFTTERDQGGTGLGLAIVQAVARTRGGEVTLKSGAGGTTFTLIV